MTFESACDLITLFYFLLFLSLGRAEWTKSGQRALCTSSIEKADNMNILFIMLALVFI
jgi:hypothetical protein